MKKKTNGTAIIFLVLAKKSAEASTTSIAVFKDEYPQQTQQKNPRARVPKRIITAM